MARDEQPREDLLAEATALVERIELARPDGAARVVIGFRRDGAPSIYFGEDPAYHLNAAGQLRRAYLDGKLFKAERGQLIAIERVRTERQVQLHSHPLDAAEAAAFVENLVSRAETLARELDAGAWQVAGQVPAEGDILSRARRLLAAVSRGVTIAASPRVG